MTRDVAPERTGWRDEKLSARHRAWGFDCPCVDLDFLVVEYDRSEPVALVEYKHESAVPQWSSHPSYRALKALARRAKVPFFAARYTDDITAFTVTPLTADAKKHISERCVMTEEEWVRFLYRLRGRVVPVDLMLGLREEI